MVPLPQSVAARALAGLVLVLALLLAGAWAGWSWQGSRCRAADADRLEVELANAQAQLTAVADAYATEIAKAKAQVKADETVIRNAAAERRSLLQQLEDLRNGEQYANTRDDSDQCVVGAAYGSVWNAANEAFRATYRSGSSTAAGVVHDAVPSADGHAADDAGLQGGGGDGAGPAR